MRAASTRYGKRKAHVAGIIALAGVFLYHGMCSLNDSSRTAGGKARRKSAAPPAAAAAAIADSSLSCDWEEGGPELFVIRHNTNHPVGECWGKGSALPARAIAGAVDIIELQLWRRRHRSYQITHTLFIIRLAEMKASCAEGATQKIPSLHLGRSPLQPWEVGAFHTVHTGYQVPPISTPALYLYQITDK